MEASSLPLWAFSFSFLFIFFLSFLLVHKGYIYILACVYQHECFFWFSWIWIPQMARPRFCVFGVAIVVSQCCFALLVSGQMTYPLEGLFIFIHTDAYVYMYTKYSSAHIHVYAQLYFLKWESEFFPWEVRLFTSDSFYFEMILSTVLQSVLCKQSAVSSLTHRRGWIIGKRRILVYQTGQE